MATNNNKVQAGRVLNESIDVRVVEISTDVGTWGRPDSIEAVTAAFSYSGVAVRVSHGPAFEGDTLQLSQVVLSRADFRTLVASYRAFERAEQAEKKREAERQTSSDDFDPFLDTDDLP